MEERKNEDYHKYYEILEEIGKGYYGIVYKGIEKKTNELRAIKVIEFSRIKEKLIWENLMEDVEEVMQTHINRFINEYEIMNICSKNNINSVKCYEYFINNEYFVIIMELCDNDLYHLLYKIKKMKDKEKFEILFQLNNTFRIMRENNIIHRDLKLDNILIKYNEDKTFTIKLSDYLCEIKRYSYPYIGAYYYMAPEILEGRESNYKIDLWSLGIIIYRLFFEEFPYRNYGLIGFVRKIKELGCITFTSTGNKELDDLIRNLLQADPKKRLSWEDYFNHPFFIKNNKRINEDYNKYYEILTTIGQGAYGNVYKGKEKETNELRAIKVMDLNRMRENLLNSFELNEIEEQIQSNINGFKNEYENMNICSKNTINSVKCYEYFINNDNLVIIMELCDKNLSKLLLERKKTFNEKEIFEILNQINNAFKIMKENKIIHRDLKLENILIKYNEDKTFTIKLSDYGCSKKVTSLSRSFSNSIVGTNIYMAPEILKGQEHNYKCDLWSLGIIIYKLFFGKPPYSGITETALINNIENGGKKFIKSTNIKELDDLINKLLEIEIDKRLSWDEYLNHPFFKYKRNINLIYETDKDNIENIFGEKFVINNKNNIELIINGTKSELISKYKLKKGVNNIEIIIKNDLTNLEYMFYKCNKLKNIDELKYLNTEKVTNFSNMFNLCSILSNIKVLENWNVSNGKDFSNMFIKCNISDLKGLEKWKVSNGNNFSGIFRGCKSLKDIYGLENWDVSNGKNFSGMFRGCSSLKNLNGIGEWNVSNGEDFSDMFHECLSLKSITEIKNWNVSKGNNFLDMFEGCTSLSGLEEIKTWGIMENELI